MRGLKIKRNLGYHKHNTGYGRGIHYGARKAILKRAQRRVRRKYNSYKNH